MNIHIKSPEEIVKMRTAGRLAAEVLEMIEPHVQVGITTAEIDRICHEHITVTQKAIPAALNYKGFPKSVCTSINNVVCHGIPADRKLRDGDIINVDVAVIKDEYYGDTSRMFIVGEGSILAKRLVKVTKECLDLGIAMVKPGVHLGDIGAAIFDYASRNRFGVVREYGGHGIGKKFHEPPDVLHYGTKGTGAELVPGMTFTIEPMINAGGAGVKLLADGWTVTTKDHSLSAQWEHTVLVTEQGHEVLTLRHGEVIGNYADV